MPAERITSLTPWHVVFILDDSGSMSGAPAASVNQALTAMIAEMEILSQGEKPYFRVSIVSFGSHARILAEAQSEQDIDVQSVATFKGDSGGTNMADGLRTAYDILQRNPGKPTDFIPYVFLLTDGFPNDRHSTAEAAKLLTSSEIAAGSPELVAIGIEGHDAEFLKSILKNPELYKGLEDHTALVRLFPAVGTVAKSQSGVDAVNKAIANI